MKRDTSTFQQNRQRGWVVVRSTKGLWAALTEAGRKVPGGQWRRWGLRLAIGWVLCAVVTAILTLLARRWEPKWLGQWDERTIASVERGPMSFPDAVLLESPGNLIYMVPLVICGAIVAIRRRQSVFAITVIVSYVLARALVYLGWSLWDRPRPRGIAGGVASPELHSFPSGHIILALSVYGLLVYAWCRASGSRLEQTAAVAVGLAWCASLGYARVRLGSHWPSDVIAGAVIGLAWVAAVIWAWRATSEPDDSVSR